MSNDISNYLDSKDRIKTWPSKKEMKVEILRYLAGKFEFGQFYTEREVNSIIDNWHTFNDYFLLRRGLVDSWHLSRTRNGARYWREEQASLEPIKEIILRNYEVEKITGMSQLNNGIGSNSFYVLCDKGEFIFKDIEMNGMNHPENEDKVLRTLKEEGIPVSEIYKTVNGDSVISEGNRMYHMQTFIAGTIYKPNTAPEWLLFESAELLGKIQNALSKLPALPVGMGEGFFNSLTPEVALENHAKTRKLAVDKGDEDIALVIEDKMRLIEKHKDVKFDFNKITCGNTHGDYAIKQIICGREKINAVIDLTAACFHPVCWEVIRSFSLADPKSRNGGFDRENFKKYLEYFLRYGSLNDYDLEIMPSMYLYQNLVCDYFNQYYQSEHKNKSILLESAMLTYEQCKVLSSYIEEGIKLF